MSWNLTASGADRAALRAEVRAKLEQQANDLHPQIKGAIADAVAKTMDAVPENPTLHMRVFTNGHLDNRGLGAVNITVDTFAPPVAGATVGPEAAARQKAGAGTGPVPPGELP